MKKHSFLSYVVCISIVTVQLFLTSCNNSSTSTNESTKDSTMAMKQDTAAHVKTLRPTGPQPAWAPNIAPEMLAVIEKLGSYGDSPLVNYQRWMPVKHIHLPRSGLFVFKSPWWFPYTDFQFATFRSLLEVYRRSWFDRLRGLAHCIWNLAQFLKNERRL